MTLFQLVQQKREEILDAAQAHGASKLRLFGSVARGEEHEGSDLDLLVEMAEGRSLLDLISLAQELQERLRCQVDIVTEAGLSPHLRHRVLSEARAL